MIKRDFYGSKHLEICVTDTIGIRISDGMFNVSAVFDGYDGSPGSLSRDTNMKVPLYAKIVENAAKVYPGLSGAIL